MGTTAYPIDDQLPSEPIGKHVVGDLEKSITRVFCAVISVGN